MLIAMRTRMRQAYMHREEAKLVLGLCKFAASGGVTDGISLAIGFLKLVRKYVRRRMLFQFLRALAYCFLVQSRRRRSAQLPSSVPCSVVHSVCDLRDRRIDRATFFGASVR